MKLEFIDTKVDILLHETAFTFLSDENFLKDWRRLLEENIHKSSVFQQPEFLLGWFKAKQKEFAPIVVVEYHGESITALLCLAVDIDLLKTPKRQMKIVGAGEYDAEYQAWICNHGNQTEFLANALDKLFGIFPNAQISLRFLLDEDVVKNISANEKLKKWVTVQEFKRPIAALQTPDFDKTLKKRHHKAKINRFNRAGNVELEVIRTKERLLEILPQIMLLYDFRQGALFNKYPSVKFLNETPLFVELIDSGIIHISILKLDNEITSSIVCYHCNSWIHLAGMITYSPFFSKWSPGLVHIYLLGERLRADGFQFFDLTPGYDGYKDKFATSYDTVYELTFSRNKIAKISKQAKVAFQNFLVKRGVRPMSFDLGIKKKKYLIGKKVMGIMRLPKSMGSRPEMVKNLDTVIFRNNSIKELLSFQEEGLLTKWEFLEDAFIRIEDGGNFVTASLKGRLVSCIWFHQSQDFKQESEKNQVAKDNLLPDFENSFFSSSISPRKLELFEMAINWHKINAAALHKDS